MDFHLASLFILSLVFLISGYIFGLNGVLYIILTSTITTGTALYIAKKRHLKKSQSNLFPIIIFLVLTVTTLFLASIDNIYKKEAHAESLLESQGVTKVTLTIKPKTSQPPPAQPTNIKGKAQYWWQSLIDYLGFWRS